MYGNRAWRRHVCRHWSAAEQADLPSARPMPLQTFCEARDGRSAPLGQHSSAPHARPRVPGKPGLATGLTAGSSTHRVHAQFLPRSSVTALLGAGSPGAVAVPVGSPSRRVAHGHTHGQVHLAAARSHADRASQTSPYASGSGTRPLRPTWARMPKTVRPLGDHALACTRSGLLARRAKLVEQAWLAVCREAVGAEGHVVPQQWLSHTSAPGVPTSDRRRLDLVVYGVRRIAAGPRLVLRCHAGQPHHRNEHPSPTSGAYSRHRLARGREPQARNLSGVAARRRPPPLRPCC